MRERRSRVQFAAAMTLQADGQLSYEASNGAVSIEVPSARATGAPVRVAGGSVGSRFVAQGPAALWALFLAAAIVFAGLLQHPGAKWLLLYGAFVLVFERLTMTSARRLVPDASSDVRGVLLASSLAAFALLAVQVVLSDQAATAVEALGIWLASIVVLVPGRLVVSRAEVRHRQMGGGVPTLIVGAGRVGGLIAKRLQQQPQLGLCPIGFLDETPLLPDPDSNHVPVLGASWDLEEVVRKHDVRHVIFSFSKAPHPVLLRMINDCRGLAVTVSLVPRLFEILPARLSVDHLGALPLISIFPSNPNGGRIRMKYALDRVAAAVLLIIFSPVLTAVGLAVLLSLGRPVIYRQRRVGRDGQEFEILKFRTMQKASDGEELTSLPPDTAPGGVEATDRRTCIGKLLRRTSLDELPQLINVLRGDMSLVGPRPERPEFAATFARDVYRYGERVRMKSGITGWAQVHGLRGKTSLADRVEWDNYYIDNWSIRLDLKILLLTMRAVLRFAAE